MVKYGAIINKPAIIALIASIRVNGLVSWVSSNIFLIFSNLFGFIDVAASLSIFIKRSSCVPLFLSPFTTVITLSMNSLFFPSPDNICLTLALNIASLSSEPISSFISINIAEHTKISILSPVYPDASCLIIFLTILEAMIRPASLSKTSFLYKGAMCPL